tara:strand:+ start:182 stop:652 length:471 start_codon:yes stop_codon:yes gene_type:complete
MALKLVRHIGTITASTLGDDAAHGLEVGKLARGDAIRVSEFGGNDVFIKVTSIDLQTAVTASNGFYVRASNTVTVVPEGDRAMILGDDEEAKIVLDTAADAGDDVLLDGTDSDSSDAGSSILVNAAEEQYFISVINETAGSDGAVHIEIVAQGSSA